MERFTKPFIIWVAVVFILSGCMYPQGKKEQIQPPGEDQIAYVQSAVEKYQQDNNGSLPIKTKEADIPVYENYLIDFNKLVPQYLSEPPDSSFEGGGLFQYVLIDVETNPKVKVFDLRITETIREIKMRIQMNGDYPPYKERISENVYSLDYSKLGFEEEPFAVSPYTNQNLPFVITPDGEIYVDYRRDLNKALQETEENYQPGEDIRHILVKDSLFVPAYSLPYTIDEKTKEPIFLVK